MMPVTCREGLSVAYELYRNKVAFSTDAYAVFQNVPLIFRSTMILNTESAQTVDFFFFFNYRLIQIYSFQ